MRCEDREQTTVWQIARESAASYLHPTTKPVALAAHAIKLMCPVARIIYEPFLGSGTVTIAAEQLGRICYGMEIEPKYIAVTLERLASMGLEPKLL